MIDTENHGIRFRRLSTLDEVDAISADWIALEERCSDHLTYFQSYDWCRGWLATFAASQEAIEPRIKTVWLGDRLVAVWPLMVQTVSGIRVLQHLGAPHSQYCNLLCDDEHLAHGLTRKLVERIEQDPDCDVAVFHPVPHHSRLGTLLKANAPMRGYGDTSALLDLTAFADSDAYRSSGGKLKKRNRNRRRNQLARKGALGFEVIWPTDPRFSKLVCECASMKRTWLRETGRASSGFSFTDFDQFLSALAGDPKNLSGACLSVLTAGDKTVAMELGFIRSGHYYSYLGSFDWSLRQLSPGKVQMEMTVCWLIDNGVKTYDLLGGESDYKQSWTSHSVALEGYSLPFSWKGRFYADAWLPVIRPLAKRLFQSLPGRLRQLVAGVQSFGLLAVGL